MGLHRRKSLLEQMAGGLRPGWPLHLRLWGRLQLGFWGPLGWLCTWRRKLGRSLRVLDQAGVWRWTLEPGFRLRLRR